MHRKNAGSASQEGLQDDDSDPKQSDSGASRGQRRSRSRQVAPQSLSHAKNRLRQDAGVRDSGDRAAVASEMEAATRHGRDHHHSHSRIGDADLRRGDRSRVGPRLDARHCDGRSEPEERGIEAGEGHFDSDRHAGPLAGPSPEHEGVQLREPAVSGDRRGGPHSADRLRRGHEGYHAAAPQETPDHAVLRHAGQERAGLGQALAVGRLVASS